MSHYQIGISSGFQAIFNLLNWHPDHSCQYLVTSADTWSHLNDQLSLFRPVTRRSISRELFETDRDRPSSSRPVARRSVSRELFDVQVNVYPLCLHFSSLLFTHFVYPLCLHFSCLLFIFVYSLCSFYSLPPPWQECDPW